MTKYQAMALALACAQCHTFMVLNNVLLRFILLTAIMSLSTGALTLAVEWLIGRRLGEWELGGIFVGFVLSVACWNWQKRRRTRVQLRRMRDSALW